MNDKPKKFPINKIKKLHRPYSKGRSLKDEEDDLIRGVLAYIEETYILYDDYGVLLPSITRFPKLRLCKFE